MELNEETETFLSKTKLRFLLSKVLVSALILLFVDISTFFNSEAHYYQNFS